MSPAEPAAEQPLPIDAAEPMATQSKQALMIAVEHGWVANYHRPYNLSLPGRLDALRAALGPDAELPTDGGIYYLVFVNTTNDGTIPVLIPEGDPRAFVFALAVQHGKADAARVLYRQGMLPK